MPPQSPNTIFAGTAGAHANRPGPDRLSTRVLLYVAGVLFIPVGMAVHGMWMYLFNYARMRWWVPLTVAVVLTFGGLVTGNIGGGALSGYIDPWWDMLKHKDGELAWLSANWWRLLWAQAWIGMLVGSWYAGVSCAWKWYRRPSWQERDIRPGPWLKRRAKKTIEEIATGTGSPDSGITLGVSRDKRDYRFAGGHPGERYGDRVVMEDREIAGHTFVCGGAGSGKALAVSTPIPTPTGFVPMGELQVGDHVFDEEGYPTMVVGAFDVMLDRDCFEVVFGDGTSVVADGEHLWPTKPAAAGGRSTATTNDFVTGRVPFDGYDGLSWRPGGAEQNHTIVEIRAVPSVPVRCIKVEAPSSLFLAGLGYAPTHNTTTMLIGMRDVIRMGRGLVFIDCKGGPDTPEQIAEWARRYDRDFFHWSIRDPKEEYRGPADAPAFYDPLSRGDASRRKDLLIGSQRWDVEYYKTVIANYLQTLFMVTDFVPPLPGVDSFTDVADLLSPNALVYRAQNIPAAASAELVSSLSRIAELGPQELSGIHNMYSRLHTLTTSTAGAWLKKDPTGKNDINLRTVAEKGQVVVFSLDTSNYEETATQLAGLIVQDLKTLSSELRTHPVENPLHVYVDEFSAVDVTNILGLLAKARDAKMPVTVATQALADLSRKEPTFLEQVLGIVSAFVAHRANTENDARIFAGLSGVKHKTLERTGFEQTSSIMGTMGAAANVGTGFLEERDEYAIQIGTFQELKIGECIYIAKAPHARYVNPVEVVRENEMIAGLKHDPGLPVPPYDSEESAPKRTGPTFPRPNMETLPIPSVSPGAPPNRLPNGGSGNDQGSGPGRPVRPGGAPAGGNAGPLGVPVPPSNSGFGVGGPVFAPIPDPNLQPGGVPPANTTCNGDELFWTE